MRRRAELVDRTRLRITEAAVRLHTTVGPSRASIAAIAEEAGVTRLTVYRHFRDQGELFSACMAHWAERHPRPDPAGWLALDDLGARARRAIGDLYAWYGAVGDEMYPIQRDFALMPPDAQARSREQTGAMAAAIAGDQGRRPGSDRRRLRSVVGHTISFWTWRSLVIEQGLSRREAVDLATGWVVAAGDGSPAGHGATPASAGWARIRGSGTPPSR